jgi:hypothetical protein
MTKTHDVCTSCGLVKPCTVDTTEFVCDDCRRDTVCEHGYAQGCRACDPDGI